ncbi:MAG: hypothetical protein ACOY46_16510 [Bacillota bacterium]
MKEALGKRWVLTTGILILILGLIHIGATPIVYKMGFNGLQDGYGKTFLYMYVSTGAAVVFAGLLTIYCSSGLGKMERESWMMATGAGIFMFLLGAGAVITMPDNPFSYITLIISLVDVVPLLMFRNKYAGINNGY